MAEMDIVKMQEMQSGLISIWLKALHHFPHQKRHFDPPGGGQNPAAVIRGVIFFEGSYQASEFGCVNRFSDVLDAAAGAFGQHARA